MNFQSPGISFERTLQSFGLIIAVILKGKRLEEIADRDLDLGFVTDLRVQLPGHDNGRTYEPEHVQDSDWQGGYREVGLHDVGEKPSTQDDRRYQTESPRVCRRPST